MKALVELLPDQFEYREWVALQWVRSYLVFEGAFPDPELAGKFESLFSPSERVCIFAVFKLILFSNMLVNTLVRDRYTDGAVCTIQVAASPVKQGGEAAGCSDGKGPGA